MKKRILTLLSFLACAISNLHAYEYFTIYFSDGTKSNAFYAIDVDSICYSKIGLDSIEYAEWKVQEIYTCDSIYRYPLAQIDSLSFKDVDINIVAEDISRANSVIVPLYMQCESIAKLSQHLSTIVDIEGVEDAWTGNQTLFVKIRDYGTISFLYPPTPSSDDENFISLESRRMIMRSNVVATNHTPIEVHNACVYFQPENNENFIYQKKYSGLISNDFNTMGISCQPITKARQDFFVKDIFDYDLIFLITHGFYEKKTNTHWLVTSNEVYNCSEYTQKYNYPEVVRKVLEDNLVYSPEKLSYTWLWEVRGGIDYAVFYTCVSDKLIASSRNSFNNSGTVIFNTACESLKQNNNLANVFLNKGAICYLGYDDSNTVGHLGGYSFYQAMLNGTCIEQAYNRIPDSFKEEYYVDTVDNKKIEYRPKLHMITKNDDDLKKCIVHTETLPINNLFSDKNSPIRLNGRIKMLNNYNYFTRYYTYGFQISTTPDMSQAVDSVAVGIYDSSTLNMNWEATLDESKLPSNTTYYYRAYMYDGYSYCYGEVKEFKTAKAGPDINPDDPDPETDTDSFMLCPDENHPHTIDLGLPSGTKWACCNVGAQAPEQYGGFYSWGETDTKSEYSFDTYKCVQVFWAIRMIDYIGSDISGTEFDAATYNWGKKWKMPTLAQCDELVNNTTKTLLQYNDISGVKFTGTNGASVFFPNAGWAEDGTTHYGECHYWSSTVCEFDFNYAHSFDTTIDHIDYCPRYYGQPVRPVRKN